MAKRYFIISNSHTRSYNKYPKKIIPIFLGSGGDSKTGTNLLNNNIYNKIKIFFNKVKLNSEDIIILNFGEAAIRNIFYGTYPHKIPIKSWIKYKKEHDDEDLKLENIKEEYVKFVDFIKKYHKNIKILSTGGSFYPMIRKIKKFNILLKREFEDKYIEIFDKILLDDNIPQKYLNTNWKNETKYSEYKNYAYDPIHLGNNTTDILLESLEFSKNTTDVFLENLKFSKNYKSYIIS